MKQALFFLALVLLSVNARADISISAVSRTITAPDGYQLLSLELVTGKGKIPERPRAIFFYIQGSGYGTVTEKIDMLASAVIFGGRVIVMEKRGCYPDSTNIDTAYKYAQKPIRVSDNLLLLDTYLKDVPSDIPVVLIGGSEGGDVAVAVAAANKRITQVILIGSAGGWSQKTEFQYMVGKYPGYLDCNSVQQLNDTLNKIETAKNDMQLWMGHPYRRWTTYMNDSAINYLKDVTAPILLIHCTEDMSVPVQSAHALVDQLKALNKNNLTYIEYKDLDHTLTNVHDNKSRYPYLEIDMIKWLQQQGIVKDMEADMFTKRVKKNHRDIFPNE